MALQTFWSLLKLILGDEDVLCPCSICLNNEGPTTQRKEHDRLHLYKMSVSYTNWIYHGELHGTPGIITDNIDPPEDDHPRAEHEDGIENERFDLLESLYPVSGFDPLLSKLIEDAKSPLGPDTDVSRFKHILTALYLKSKHKISNKAFDELRQLNNSSYPSSVMPKSYNEMKQYVKALGLSYEKFHVCR